MTRNFSIQILFGVVSLILVRCSSPVVVDGYTDRTSYQVGDSVTVFLNATDSFSNHSVTLYNVLKKPILDVKADLFPQSPQSDKPWENGFGYQPGFSWEIPDLPSGIYQWENEVPFLIRTQGNCDFQVLYSSNTDLAYNPSGGKSLYGYNSSDQKPAQQVSFHRPGGLPYHSTDILEWFAGETSYSIGYLADSDLESYNQLNRSKLLVIIGHSEYWSRQARLNIDRYVKEGNHLLILGGNTMWWQVRYSDDFTKLIAYKDKADPFWDPLLHTKLWENDTLEYPVIPSIGLSFSFGGYGKREGDGGWDGYKITAPNSPLLIGSGLEQNEILPLPTDEYDGVPLKVASNGTVVVSDSVLKQFYRYEVIGYDRALRGDIAFGVWIVAQKTSSSGKVINVGSTNWCKGGIGGAEGKRFQSLTANMIDRLLSEEEVFSPEK